MEVYRKMSQLFGEAARSAVVRSLTLGLGYTAVELTDGRIGIAYTYFTEKSSCSLFQDQREFEGAAAASLLQLLESENLVERSAALAAVNALNARRCAEFPADRDSVVEDLAVQAGDVVAMAGYFGPVVAKIEAAGASVKAHDMGKGIGERDEFYRFLASGEARGLVFTSTSVINGTTEEVLSHLHRDTRCALIGPTTPMVPQAFDHLPIHFLGGIAPRDREGIDRAVRNGRGTRHVLRAADKVYYRRGIDPVPPLG
jgi:hypothetical protein